MSGDSDKSFWHRYLEFYEEAFSKLGQVSSILEFGVFKGDSIRWLAQRFPDARIVGCDIIPPQPSWPVSPRIGYATLDQGSLEQIRRLFQHLNIRFDLIIEDGSHQPVHQRNCLVESLACVRPGGIYVLEDLHTAHPQHPLYRELGRSSVVGPLHLLLALEHLQANGRVIDEPTLSRLTGDSLFSREDVELVARRVASINLYRRATLPHRCYNCGSSDFDYGTLRCRCGADLYDEADSMSAVLHVSA
ncbi:MAG TPA: class I SAM-dependent methyltransferase [Vicinamibacterales bacterium]